MIAQARKMIKATMDAAAMIDETLTADKLAAALDALEGKSLAGIVNPAPMPRILSTKQMAELLKVSERSVRKYAQRGRIRRVYTGEGKKRKAIGYSEESAREFLEKIAGDRPQPVESKVA